MYVIDLLKSLNAFATVHKKNTDSFKSMTPTQRSDFYKTLGGVSFDYETNQQEVNGQKIISQVDVTGTLPTISSVLSGTATGLTTGYTLGRMTGQSQKEIEQEGALPLDDVKQLIWIPAFSSLVQIGLEHFVFEKYLGGDIGKISIPTKNLNKSIISKLNDDENYAKDAFEIVNTKPIFQDKAKFNQALEGAQTAILTNSIISTTEALANVYHGYHRHNQSKAWGLVWGLFGNLGLATAQGFAQEIKIKPVKVVETEFPIPVSSVSYEATSNPAKRRSTRKSAKRSTRSKKLSSHRKHK